MSRLRRGLGRGEARSAWLDVVSTAALAAALCLIPVAHCSAETLRQALTSAYQTNPKLDAERAKLRATDEDVSRAEAGYRPTVQGAADIGHQQSTSHPASASAGQS